jgi:hypothetical protein
MSVLRDFWQRVTRKKPSAPTVLPGVEAAEIDTADQKAVLYNKVYSTNLNVQAEFPYPRNKRFKYDTIEEALAQRHVKRRTVEIPTPQVDPDAVSKLIREFFDKHKGPSQAHRVMVVPEAEITVPTYTVEEALAVRNDPDHPINRAQVVLRVPKPSLGESDSE